MKYNLILFFIIVYFQRGINTSQVTTSWDDAQKLLKEFSAELDIEMQNATEHFAASLNEAITAISVKSEDALSKINSSTAIYINEYEEWIQNATAQKVDVSSCTKDKENIEDNLPLSTYNSILNCFSTHRVKSIKEYSDIYFDLDIKTKKVLRDTQTKLDNCEKTDETCIQDVVKTVESYEKSLPVEINEAIEKVENIMQVLVKVLDTCIDTDVGKLQSTEKELTAKGIECIKKLIKH